MAYPVADLPDSRAKQELRGCDAGQLYYGVAGVKPDYVKARQCAFIQLESSNSLADNFFSGSTILMMIYANGLGVNKNIDLALKAACQVGGAAAETAGRYVHLNQLRKQNASQPFDACDDITSGEMQNICSDNAASYQQTVLKQQLAGITAKWSIADRQALEKLIAIRDDYFTAAAENEISNQGTAAASLQIDRQSQLESDFLLNLQQFEHGQLPHYNADNFAASDRQLNQLYNQSMLKKSISNPTIIIRLGFYFPISIK